MVTAHSRVSVLTVLTAGVLIVSTASILVRWLQADGVTSLAIAVWRLGFAALILLPPVLVHARAELARLPARAWLLAGAAGGFLAVHFATWILSLEYTSVASSVALVTTNPIWIALASWLLFRERPSGAMALGIALAMLGSAVIFLADGRAASAAPAAVLGNTLALTGSLAICGYLLIGRALRRTVSLLAYIAVVYGAAAVCLLAIALAAGAPLAGFAASAWLMLLALAVGPQVLGHSSFNWALKYASATLIAVAVLGEAIGSTTLAWLILGEPVGAAKLAGMALLLMGVFLAARQGAESIARAADARLR